MICGYRCPDGREVSFAECMSKDCEGCPPKIFRLAILLTMQYRNPSEISVTNLTSPCMKKIVWEKQKNYFVSPTWASTRGNLLHAVLSLVAQKYKGDDELISVINGFTENIIVEKKFSRVINGITLTGKIDFYDKVSKELVDFKSLGNASFLLKEGKSRDEHIMQVNLYRYLMREIPVDRIRIFYLCPSEIFVTGRKYVVVKKRKKGDIREEVHLQDIPIWSDSQVMDLIAPKLKKINHYLNNPSEIPDKMTDEKDKWLCRFCSFVAECK